MSDKCNVNIEHQTYKLGVRWTNKAFLMTLSLSTAPSRCIGGWGSILQHPRLYPGRRGHEAGTPDPRGCHQTSFQPRPDPWLAVISMKITLTGPWPYLNELFMKLSDNFRLIEVLPDVPSVVPLDLCLDVHLEVLTSSDPTWVIPTHPRSIWHV